MIFHISNDVAIIYLDSLIDKIYKILPMKESEIKTLDVYLNSLQIELIGSLGVIEVLNNNTDYLSILNTIQYFIDNDFNVKVCKREVFKCIKTIEKIKSTLYIKEVY